MGARILQTNTGLFWRMKMKRTILIILLVLLYAGQWVTIAHQCMGLSTRHIPEERLVELLEQSRLNEHRLASVAAQNAVLTTRTLTILERITPTPSLEPYHGPDEPLVLYEAVPVTPQTKIRSHK